MSKTIALVTINPTVMKFGGTSVRDAAAFRRVADIVLTRRDVQPVVVVSAMSGVTDALVSAAGAARNLMRTPDAATHAARIFDEYLDEHFARHREIALTLLPPPSRFEFAPMLDVAAAEIKELLAAFAFAASMHELLQDSIISHGERLSSQLLARILDAYGLPARFVDARRCIVTDDEHGNAEPHLPETMRATERELVPHLHAGRIPVIGGFIAASMSGATTTLGRNGSDYSATLVGAALRARGVEIWTDTSGVLTADPRIFPEAVTVPYLSYKEAADLARAGAKVLHPKTIRPLVERSIPLHVRNSQDASAAGTAISAGVATPEAKSIALKRSVTVIQITPALAGDDALFMQSICNTAARHSAGVDLALISHSGAAFVASDEAAAEQLAMEIEPHGAICIERRRALLTIVGERMSIAADRHARLLHALGDARISVLAHGASPTGRSFVIEDADAKEAVTRLHRELFESDG